MLSHKCVEYDEQYPKYMIMCQEDKKVGKICILLNKVRNHSLVMEKIRNKVKCNSIEIGKIRMDVDLIVMKMNETGISRRCIKKNCIYIESGTLLGVSYCHQAATNAFYARNTSTFLTISLQCSLFSALLFMSP